MLTKAQVIKKIQETFLDNTTGWSTDEAGKCLYGPTANGVGCFVGMFMPPELANRLDIEFRNEQITKLFERDPETTQFINNSGLSLDFWSALQHTHDSMPSRVRLKILLDELLVYY